MCNNFTFNDIGDVLMASDFQLKKFAQFFKACDLDGDNYLTEQDFFVQLERLGKKRGIDPESPEAKAEHAERHMWWQGLQSMVDADGDGKLSFEEFVGFWAHIADTATAEIGTDSTPTYDMITNSAISTFTFLDANNDGTLSEKEYTDWLYSWSIPDANGAAAFQSLTGGADTLDQDRVVECVVNFYIGDDPDAPGTNLYGIIG